jgi:outer membrane immunogenic protein
MNKSSAWVCVIIFAFAIGSAQAQNFNGFYVGANVGAAYGTTDAQTTTVFSPTGYFATTSPGAIAIAGNEQLRPTRFTGGVEAGFNHQNGSWVFGVETELGSMHLHDSATKSGTYPCCAPTGFTVTQTENTDWLFTLRPRAGITHGPVLFYGTGGLAVTNLNFNSLFTDTFATANATVPFAENVRGWAYGGGVEFKTSKHWSLKGEFLRLDFGSFTRTTNNLTAFTPPIPFPTNPFTANWDLTVNHIRFGANYHF